jgi:hypothetical protein
MTKDEKRQYAREYYKKNKSRILEKARLWRECNPERARENARAWARKNPDKVKENARIWRENNSEYLKERSKEYHSKLKTDRSRMAQALYYKTKSATKRLTRTLENNLTIEYIQSLLEKQNYRCALSGIELDHKAGTNGLRVASVDRKNSKRGYVKGNVQIVLNCLNKAKGDASNMEFRELLLEIKKTKVA